MSGAVGPLSLLPPCLRPPPAPFLRSARKQHTVPCFHALSCFPQPRASLVSLATLLTFKKISIPAHSPLLGAWGLVKPMPRRPDTCLRSFHRPLPCAGFPRGGIKKEVTGVFRMFPFPTGGCVPAGLIPRPGPSCCGEVTCPGVLRHGGTSSAPQHPLSSASEQTWSQVLGVGNRVTPRLQGEDQILRVWDLAPGLSGLRRGVGLMDLRGSWHVQKQGNTEMGTQGGLILTTKTGSYP